MKKKLLILRRTTRRCYQMWMLHRNISRAAGIKEPHDIFWYILEEIKIGKYWYLYRIPCISLRGTVMDIITRLITILRLGSITYYLVVALLNACSGNLLCGLIILIHPIRYGNTQEGEMVFYIFISRSNFQCCQTSLTQLKIWLQLCHQHFKSLFFIYVQEEEFET